MELKKIKIDAVKVGEKVYLFLDKNKWELVSKDDYTHGDIIIRDKEDLPF